ncbi:hypothetical protein PHYC_03705 [Phycisphaerales bacterium]|nr:hypothetical protein PHYC_03705 [Phycisphaerales bacterium]
MLAWLKQLDELLRGDRTRSSLLSQGDIPIPLRRFMPIAIVLGCAYGFFMGWFAIARGGDGWKQMLAGTIKLPALFLLTLLVTFPSLYVFSALAGSRLTFRSTMRLLVAAIVVNLAVGASLGPILGFFTLSTSSYHFMILLNVALLGVAGIIGVTFLQRTLRRVIDAQWTADLQRQDEAESAKMAGENYDPNNPPALPRRTPPRAGDAATGIFAVWMLVYGLVGTQMGWLLRPFIGAPGAAFELFRDREGSAFQAIGTTLSRLLGL